MDWKELLSSKIASGELEREEFVEPEAPANPSKPYSLRVSIDRKGRKGKTATIIEGFNCSENELLEIAAKIKQRLGTGGSARAGEILIQGERLEDVRNLLKQMGFKIK